MTLVIDASSVIDLLLRSPRDDRVLGLLADRRHEQMATVAHLDAEVLSGLARTHRAGHLDAADVGLLLRRLGELAVTRLPITAELLGAAWAMRANVATRDALYVAAARALDAELVTTDDRLARAVPDVVAAVPPAL